MGARRAMDERVLRAAIDQSPRGILLVSRGAVAYANARATSLIGGALGSSVTAPPPGWTAVPLAGCGAEDLTMMMEGDAGGEGDLQARLVLADRMVSVGTLAAGVAHEINNPLASVLTNVTFAIDELRRARERAGAALAPLLDDVMEALADAASGGERMRGIVHDLSGFAQGGDEGLGPVDVERVITAAVGMIAHEARHRARVVKDVANVPAVQASKASVGQVVLNLLMNAAQAIREGEASKNEIRVTVRPSGDDFVEIRVSDTGRGIAPPDLPRIFDPFFTTKPVGVGTGLGLWISHSIVRSLGGEIRVESALGEGTTFTVTLPVAPPARASQDLEAAARSGDDTTDTRRGRVLIVDDDPMMAKAVRRALAKDHDVVTLTSARAALDQLRSGVEYDVVLCDLMMPEMTGMDFHEELAKHSPELAAGVVFFTGGAFTPRAREFLASVTNARLGKPIDYARLRDIVRARLPSGE